LIARPVASLMLSAKRGDAAEQRSAVDLHH